MPTSPAIGRPTSNQPLAETHSPSSSTAPDSGKPGGGAPHAGPAAEDKIGALASNSTQSAAGKGRKASFAAKVSSAATNAASVATNAATNAASVASNAAQAGAANLAGRTARLGAFSQGAATVANGMTGMAAAGMSVIGGVMQMEQAATMQIAEVMKQGARNVEEASKG